MKDTRYVQNWKNWTVIDQVGNIDDHPISLD